MEMPSPDNYRELGLNLRPASMERVSGWSAILQRLGDPAAGLKPALFIHQRCKYLTECLPCLQRDPIVLVMSSGPTSMTTEPGATTRPMR
jgi:hypothetical protein